VGAQVRARSGNPPPRAACMSDQQQCHAALSYPEGLFPFVFSILFWLWNLASRGRRLLCVQLLRQNRRSGYQHVACAGI
jgi:hypothetical protein